jgi:hypothetical protein
MAERYRKVIKAADLKPNHINSKVFGVSLSDDSIAALAADIKAKGPGEEEAATGDDEVAGEAEGRSDAEEDDGNSAELEPDNLDINLPGDVGGNGGAMWVELNRLNSDRQTRINSDWLGSARQRNYPGDPGARRSTLTGTMVGSW